MKRFVFAFILGLMAFGAVTPMAQARDHVSIGFGCCGGGYYPYYAPYYDYPPPYYYAPPPTVVYAPAPATTYVVQQPPSVPITDPNLQYPTAAPAAEPTFVDKKGRTCRKFQTMMDGAPVNGTACLQPDGSWRSVGE